MQWSFKKNTGKKATKSKSLLSFSQKYYSVALWVLLAVTAAFGIYTLYTLSSDTLISQKKVDAADLQMRQTQLNISRYEATRTLLQKKQGTKSDVPKVKNLFGISTSTSITENQAPLP